MKLLNDSHKKSLTVLPFPTRPTQAFPVSQLKCVRGSCATSCSCPRQAAKPEHIKESELQKVPFKVMFFGLFLEKYICLDNLLGTFWAGVVQAGVACSRQATQWSKHCDWRSWKIGVSPLYVCVTGMSNSDIYFDKKNHRIVSSCRFFSAESCNNNMFLNEFNISGASESFPLPRTWNAGHSG